MEYNKSLRAVGLKYLFFFCVLFVVVFCVERYSAYYPQFDFFWGFTKFIARLVSLLFLLRGIVFIVIGGGWKILVTESFIRWEVPPKSNFLFLKSDDSFALNFGDIDYVISEHGGVDFPSLSLVFIAHSGQRFKVSDESGVKLSKVQKLLVDRGIEIRNVSL
ncbi:hypothetical protein ACH518_17305 [Methylomonas sp. HW2-6]|uniref:hypothetical protein n=1 Tax=Methylomonas TaxID=416 RepID=UPI0011282B28|nr:hypothetical protein [Methylomonas koyamae]TPQ29689.1 hypothetical protein C2U68_01325 [Methylomonas koyamae]